MPHVEIKCYSGKTDEQKTKCAEKLPTEGVEKVEGYFSKVVD